MPNAQVNIFLILFFIILFILLIIKTIEISPQIEVIYKNHFNPISKVLIKGIFLVFYNLYSAHLVLMLPGQSSKNYAKYYASDLNHQNQSQNNIQDSTPEQIAIYIKNPQKRLLYYHPLTKDAHKNCKIFHPKDWSLENFIIGRYLGRGKYGRVYLAKEKKSKLIMALKSLSKSKILNQEVLNQIRRQIQIHSHLKHKNILQMYGFFFDDKNIYIMMEYSAEGDLYGLLKKQKRFQQKDVRKFMKQMVEAIHYLQSMNIIHRDIKPENIMVSQNGQIKLSDFGWSIKSTSTERKTFCGTLDYFSPQIVKYRPFDRKVDNWCLGILAYELLCGSAPFYDSERKKMFEMILRKDIVFPTFASQGFRDFVNKLTKKNPKERMELSEALKHPWLIEDMDLENSNF